MSQEITEFEKLLDEFKKVYDPNRPKYEQTYLEICSYPGHRLEEICSKIFAFFFDTNNPHGMGCLFYETLIEVYQEKYIENNKDNFTQYRYPPKIDAKLEDHTKNGNRIDLLLTTENLIICIENKIDTPLHNDLGDYSEHVKNICNGRDCLFILFALYEKEDYKNKKFKLILYKEFLDKLKQNLGYYLFNCNKKYLAILEDFVQFLYRRGGFMSDLTDKEKKFFSQNDEMLEKLINRRNEFIKEQEKEFSQRRDYIVACLNEKDKSALSEDWWMWPKQGVGKGLGGKFKNGDEEREIGIEAGFSNNGEFNINYTIWTSTNQAQKRAVTYEKVLGVEFKLNGQKWCANAIETPLNTNNNDEIVNELYEIYKKVANAVSRI